MRVFYGLCSSLPLGGATPEESRCLNLPANQLHRLSHAATCRNGHQHRLPAVEEAELLIDEVILSQYSPLTRHLKQATNTV